MVDLDLYKFEAPYSLNFEEKTVLMLKNLNAANGFHNDNSEEFSNIVKSLFPSYCFSAFDLADLPFLPVRAFKNLHLASVPSNDISKILTSSGTSGQKPSRIVLDSFTAQLQSKVLTSLTSYWIGKARRPMVIFDFANTRASRNQFNARAAGIAGFSTFGRKPIYALDSNLELTVNELLEYYNGYQNILGFGFTFLIWSKIISELRRKNIRLPFKENSVLIHGGGWKKIEAEKVEKEEFDSDVRAMLGFDRVINYYGMVEQVGSVYFECEKGFFHAPDFSELLIRDPLTHDVLPFGQPGLIQLLSVLPRSYPGNSILTEDIGILHGRDNCGCGRKGSFFQVLGRQTQAEPRGCSDVVL
jgi:phenylacetate-coenzyme A ligase PaaK-like adenylate-forming protein